MAQAEPEISYVIDHQVIEARGRSATALVRSRLCEASKSKLRSGQSLHTMGFQALRRLVRQHCREDPDYLNPNLPVMEVAFRILLATQKEPVPLSEIHWQLSRIWMDAPWPRHITPEGLARVLAHDTYYGVVEVTSAASSDASE